MPEIVALMLGIWLVFQLAGPLIILLFILYLIYKAWTEK